MLSTSIREMRYIFADLNETFVNEIKKMMSGHPDCEFHVGDVKKLIGPRRAYVTPANVMLFQDAGLDRVYTREIFPGTEKTFREFVKKNGRISTVGKPYWPIGSALMTEPKADHFLIASPTMLMPQPVKDTRNAYNATLAALCLASIEKRIESIVIPAMCCGWGKMSERDAARQIRWAILDFEARIGGGKYHRFGDVIAYSTNDDYMREQPNFYENSEFKEIKPDMIIYDRS